MKTRIKVALTINILMIIFEIAGTWISYSNSGISNLVFYTVDSNILAFISCVAFVIMCLMNKNSRAVSMLRYIATINLALTFTIVVFVFVPMCVPYGFDAVADILYRGPQIFHHVLCPILSFVSFAFFEENEIITRKNSAFAVAFTLLYAVVTLTLNILKVLEGPYPFLYVYKQPVWASVMWFVLIPLIAYGYSLLIGFIYTKKNK